MLGSIEGINGATSHVNVGIGTTRPVERLHVVGNIRMDGGRFEMFNNGESVFIGQGAGASDDFSNQNVAIGYNSLPANTYGDKNTTIGYNSLVYNVFGSQNTAIGAQSLYANTSSYNTAIGYYALNNNTTGQ